MEKMDTNLLQCPVDRHSRGRPSPIEKAALGVSMQVLDALAYLHSLNIVHRDVKPENILVSRGYRDSIVVKLADLGSARDVKRSMQWDHKDSSMRTSWSNGGDLTEYVGSRWYRAPELLGSGTEYSLNCDVWSLGCTLCEFISGSPIFPGKTEQEVLDRIVSYYTRIPETVSQSLSMRGFSIRRLGPKDRRSFQSELPNVGTIFRSLLDRMLNLDMLDRENAIEFLEETTALNQENNES
jgi:serine/threonine protein kinase